MSFSSLGYVIKETALSLKRNAWMSLASISTVGISLLILGFAFALVYNTNRITTTIESDIEISAFIQLDLTRDQVQVIKNKIEAFDGVKSVELLTKEQALQQFQTSLGNDVLSNLGGNNPLPDKLTIKAQNAKQVKDLAGRVEGITGVDKVRYGQGIVERILLFTHWVRWLGFAMIGLLALGSVVLISITIRLTVFARRREIQIMKFVGAADWFIRWPFLLEGMLLGLAGAAVASVIVDYGYLGLVAYLKQNLAFIPVSNDGSFILQLTLLLLGSGTLIGALGSIISLRKFLKV